MANPELRTFDLIDRETGARTEVRLAEPMQQDTAYMPVPRCDACRWWDRLGEIPSLGACSRENATGAKLCVTQAESPSGAVLLTNADFGCVQQDAK